MAVEVGLRPRARLALLVAAACAVIAAAAPVGAADAGAAADALAPAVPVTPVAAAAAVAAAPRDAAATAKRTPIVLANPGFEEVSPRPRRFVGWDTSVHAVRDAYLFALDDHEPHGGKLSMRITRNSGEPWGLTSQTLKQPALIGRTVEFSAWLRTDHATGPGAVVVLRSLKFGAVDQVVTLEPPVTGSTPWKRYSVKLLVPPNTSHIDLSAMMQGPGTLWVDDAELAIVEGP